MAIKQAGLFTPLFVSVLLIVAATLMPSSSSVHVSKYERLRYQHSMWWFWQQAAAHYYRKYDLWPQTLTELSSTFELAPAPNYLSGFNEGNRFRLSWLFLTPEQIDLLNSKLTHPHVEVHEDRIDAIMGMTSEAPTFDGVYRSESSTMASNLSFEGHSINNVQAFYAKQVIVKAPSEFNRLRATTSTMAWIANDQAILVEKISPNPLRADELTKRLEDISQLHSKLEAYMQSEP